MSVYIGLLMLSTMLLLLNLCFSKSNLVKLRKEKEKVYLYKELLELEREVYNQNENGLLKNYKCLQHYLLSTTEIVDLIGMDMNLNNILITEVRNKVYHSKRNKLIREYYQAEKDIKRLVEKKADIVNQLARLKHPITFKFARLRKKKLFMACIILFMKISIKTLEICSKFIGWIAKQNNAEINDMQAQEKTEDILKLLYTNNEILKMAT